MPRHRPVPVPSSHMSKSSGLPYYAPFRYTKPALDLQAMLGAQTGNPPILPVEEEPAQPSKKRTASAKKSAKSQPKAKASKPASKASAAKPKPGAKR